jgi:hypothetical protein
VDKQALQPRPTAGRGFACLSFNKKTLIDVMKCNRFIIYDASVVDPVDRQGMMDIRETWYEQVKKFPKTLGFYFLSMGSQPQGRNQTVGRMVA